MQARRLRGGSARFFLIGALALLGGCAHQFRNEAEFQAYLKDLNLSGATVSEAEMRLSANGFACSPVATSAVSCTKQISGFACAQHLNVSLSKAESGFSNYEQQLGWVCL